MNWKKKYDKWQVIFANFTSIILIFAGGYILTTQPSSIEYPFAAGVWATLLGCSMAISSVILDLRIFLEHKEDDS